MKAKKWINKVKVALIKNDLEQLNKLLDIIPNTNDLDLMIEMKYLINNILEIFIVEKQKLLQQKTYLKNSFSH